MIPILDIRYEIPNLATIALAEWESPKSKIQFRTKNPSHLGTSSILSDPATDIWSTLANVDISLSDALTSLNDALSEGVNVIKVIDVVVVSNSSLIGNETATGDVLK